MILEICLLIFGLLLASERGAAREPCLNSVRGIAHGIARDTAGRILPYRPYDGFGVIVDTNILHSMTDIRNKDRDPDLIRWRSAIRHLEKAGEKRQGKFHVWMPDGVVTEITTGVADLNKKGFPPGFRRIRPEVSRDDGSYQLFRDELKKAGVGVTRKSDGSSDQQIITDVLFSERSRGAVPTFMTADKGIIKPLCRFNPDCQKALERGKLYQSFKDGFVVNIQNERGEKRALRLIPVE